MVFVRFLLISFCAIFCSVKSWSETVGFNCPNSESRVAKSDIEFTHPTSGARTRIVSHGQAFTSCEGQGGRDYIPVFDVGTPSKMIESYLTDNHPEYSESGVTLLPNTRIQHQIWKGDKLVSTDAITPQNKNYQLSMSYATVDLKSKNFENSGNLLYQIRGFYEDRFECGRNECSVLANETQKISISNMQTPAAKASISTVPSAFYDKEIVPKFISSETIKSEEELDVYFKKFVLPCNGPTFKAYMSEYKQYFKSAAEEFRIPEQLLACFAFKESDFEKNAYNSTTRARGLGQFLPSTIRHIDAIVSRDPDLLPDHERDLQEEKNKENPSRREIEYLEQLVGNASLSKQWENYFKKIDTLDTFKKHRSEYPKGMKIPPESYSGIGAKLPANAIGAMGLYLRFISDRIAPTLKQIPGYKGDNHLESVFLVGASYHIGFVNFEILMESAGNWDHFQKNLLDPKWVEKTINTGVPKINAKRKARYDDAVKKYKEEVELAKKEKRKSNLSMPKHPKMLAPVTEASSKEFVEYRISAQNCLEKGNMKGPIVAGTSRTREACPDSAFATGPKEGVR